MHFLTVMRTRRLSTVWAALLLVTTIARAQSRDTLVVATYGYGTLDRRGAIAPLARHLGERLQLPVRIVTAPDPVALADSARQGRADVIVTNTFGYLLMADASPRIADAVVMFHVPPGVRTNYSAVIVSGRDDVRDLSALQTHMRQLRFGFVSPGSTTGNLIPRLVLATHGLADPDQQLAGVIYAGTHAATFTLLRDRKADVVALATEEFNRQRGELPEAERARYRVVWESPDIQLGPVAVRSSLPKDLRERISSAVVGLERTNQEAFSALRGGWTEARLATGLVAADDSNYAPTRRLFGEGNALTSLIARLSR